MDHALDDEAGKAARHQVEAAIDPAVIAQSRFFDFSLTVAYPLPRIVPLLAHDFLKPAADEKLHRVEAGLIHVAQDRMHHARGHVVRPQARVAVAHRGINDANFVHGKSSIRDRSRYYRIERKVLKGI